MGLPVIAPIVLLTDPALLPDLIEAGGRSWKIYQEDLPLLCIPTKSSSDSGACRPLRSEATLG